MDTDSHGYVTRTVDFICVNLCRSVALTFGSGRRPGWRYPGLGQRANPMGHYPRRSPVRRCEDESMETLTGASCWSSPGHPMLTGVVLWLITLFACTLLSAADRPIAK